MNFLMNLPNSVIYLSLFLMGAVIWYYIVKWIF